MGGEGDAGRHGVFYERWNGIPGVTVDSLRNSPRFREPADLQGLVEILEFPVNTGEFYGVRIRGYIVPPKTGEVRFILSSDDNSELWLSPDEDPAAMRRVAWLAGEGRYGWTLPYEAGRVASQTSPAVEVVKDRKYYFEIFHKQGDGDDHFELQWRYESDSEASHIPASALRPWIESGQRGMADAAGDPWEDSDGDGVMNIDERAAGTNPLDGGREPGVLLWEIWHAVEGEGVADLVKHPAFAGPADRVDFLRGSSTPVSFTGNLGTRLSGFVVPAESGEYEFAVTSDNAAELWLSPGDSWLDKERIAFNDRWRPRGSWHLPPSQCSKPFRLEAGQAYYIEILHKDASPPGWVTVGWRKSGEDASFGEIAPEFLRSPGKLEEDQQRSFLPNLWAAEMSARVPREEGEAPARFTQYGDPDGDGIPNHIEARLGTDPLARTLIPGSLTREWWFNVRGQSVTRARNEGVFLRPASMITFTEGSASERQTTDWFASRLRGTLTAPVGGSYRFWVAGDNHCELWLSTDGSKFFKRKIAEVAPSPWDHPDAPAWTGRDDWDARDGQISAAIELEAGESYFIEVLHKDGSGDDHVSLAWQRRETGANEWSERVAIPAEALHSYAGSDDDQDDDYLPDGWEEQYGLDPKDNGRGDPEKQGEHGDFDNDGLTNREEFLLGTNPAHWDSDGDGASDLDELRLYKTDPTKKDVVPPVEYLDVSLRGFEATPGNWFVTSEGSIFSMNRRQPVDFTFDADEPGIYVVELNARVRSKDDYKPAVPVTVLVNEVRIGSIDILAADTQGKWHTQWLPAGRHTVRIDNRNIREGVGLEILSVVLHRYDKSALNDRAIPAWMERLLHDSNRISGTGRESAVSPACIEGVSRIEGDVAIVASESAVEAKPGLAGSWYADVPLSASGTTQVTASFERGALRAEEEFHWIDTNVFDAGETLRIRVGDSLKFIAYRAGAEGNEFESGVLTVNGALMEGDPVQGSVVVFFGEKGRHLVQAAVSEAGGKTDSAVVEVEVVSADFGPVLELIDRLPREWELPDVPKDVFLDAEELLEWKEIETEGSAPRRIEISYKGDLYYPRVVARLSAGGSILAATHFEAVRFSSATETGDAKVVEVLPDGTQVVEIGYVLNGPIPRGLSIWIDLFVPNAVFSTGDTRYHLTAADFDENGEARLRIYAVPDEEGVVKVCHWINPEYAAASTGEEASLTE